ncbi:MAG TPA: hypothetical protein VGM05_06480 [Planctomycetaceae bacterium]|jgi:hypothetical protein
MTILRPLPRLGIRLVAFAALAAFASIGETGWGAKLGFCAAMAFFLGSYRVARLNDGRFERRMVIMFVPLRTKKFQLDRCTDIETFWEEGMGVEWAWITGGPFWILWTIFDWIVPWLGGTYRLRLRRVKGGPALVWQGQSEANFQANLALLQNNTGLPVQRAGR